MSGEDGDMNGNGRVTNNQLLRDLLADVKQQGRDLAALVERSAQSHQAVEAALNRIEAVDRDVVDLRGRTGMLEQRPIAMTPEVQGDLRSQVRESARDIIRIDKAMHDDRNKVQLLTKPVFASDEVEEIKRLLALTKRRGLEDILTDEQRVDLLKVRDFLTPEKTEALEDIVERQGSTIRHWKAFLTHGGQAAAIAAAVVLVMQNVPHLH